MIRVLRVLIALNLITAIGRFRSDDWFGAFCALAWSATAYAVASALRESRKLRAWIRESATTRPHEFFAVREDAS